MTNVTAAQAVSTLLDKQRELLVAIALADEAQTTRRKELEIVRAQLTGMQLGQQLAVERAAAEARADG